MKVVTLRGTWEIDMQQMKAVRPDGRTARLDKVPSPVAGMRMELEVDGEVESTEPVTEVQL